VINIFFNFSAIFARIHKDSDSEITLEDVKVWFFETEKLIRITANLSLEVTSQQGINQLRYAAHHILKSNKQEDTIEAYKHCKRAYYDTLDLFNDFFCFKNPHFDILPFYLRIKFFVNILNACWHFLLKKTNNTRHAIGIIHKDSDSEITREDVKVWFFETEKLIRTTANLSLEVTSQQGINQLRYAAHHILVHHY
jgi:hypothetical protein